MKKYRIKKLGKNYDNRLSEMSKFGYSKEYFKGFALYKPKIGERFILVNDLGRIVINTSPLVKIEEGKLITMYSIYSIEEL